eukprot:g2422.t1
MGRAKRSGGSENVVDERMEEEEEEEEDAIGVAQIQPLAKALAGTEKRVRDKAVRNLRRWLSYRKGISRLNLMRVWKALFYCMWMSDKVPIQQELASTLAKLTHCFSSGKDALRFVACFFDTLQREWGGLDHLRMDKFLSLTRQILFQTMVYVARKKWNDDDLEQLTEILMTQMQRRNGIRRHLVDIFWTELDRSMESTGTRTAEALSDSKWEMLMEPFAATGSLCKDKSFQSHVLETVFEPLLEDDGEDADAPRPEKKFISEMLFKMASDPDTVERYRSGLYSLRKRFRKRVSKQLKVISLRASETSDAVSSPSSSSLSSSASQSLQLENAVDPMESAEASAKKDIVKKKKRKKKSRKRKESKIGTSLEDPPSEAAKEESSGDDRRDETSRKRKKRKQSRPSRRTTTETTPECSSSNTHKGHVHFDLTHNQQQTVAEARRAARSPIPPARSVKAPAHGILRTSPAVTRSASARKAPQSSARRRSSRRRKAVDYFSS